MKVILKVSPDDHPGAGEINQTMKDLMYEPSLNSGTELMSPIFAATSAEFPSCYSSNVICILNDSNLYLHLLTEMENREFLLNHYE